MYRILWIPLLSALIGWLSIALSVKLMRCSLNKNDQQWADVATQVLLTEFLSPQMIVEGLGAADVADQLDGLLSGRIQTVLDRLKETTPMVGMFLNESLSDKIKKMALEEIQKEWPALQRSMTKAVFEKLDLQSLIATKLKSVDPIQMEKAIQAMAGSQLQKLALTTAALGFLIGLVQIGLVAWCA